MNWRAIGAIVRKDLQVVQQSKAVLTPLIIVPLVLLVLMPGIGGYFLARAQPNSEIVADFRDEAGSFFENLPPSIEAQLARYDNEVQRITYLVFNLFFAPFYLMLPTMAANVIAADSFAGEKERKTLEALIHSPTSDRELYIAKLLGPWLAGVLVAVVGYVLFALVVTLTTLPLMGVGFIMSLTWLLLVLWVAPAAAGIGLGAMVLVSSRVSTFQEAYQLGGMVVIPIVLLIFGQLTGVVYFSPWVSILIGGVLWLITLALMVYGARTFQRGQLLARL